MGLAKWLAKWNVLVFVAHRAIIAKIAESAITVVAIPTAVRSRAMARPPYEGAPAIHIYNARYETSTCSEE